MHMVWLDTHGTWTPSGVKVLCLTHPITAPRLSAAFWPCCRPRENNSHKNIFISRFHCCYWVGSCETNNVLWTNVPISRFSVRLGCLLDKYLFNNRILFCFRRRKARASQSMPVYWYPLPSSSDRREETLRHGVGGEAGCDSLVIKARKLETDECCLPVWFARRSLWTGRIDIKVSSFTLSNDDDGNLNLHSSHLYRNITKYKKYFSVLIPLNIEYGEIGMIVTHTV